MTNINWTKVHEALNWIKENEDRWYQGAWARFRTMEDSMQGNACGTHFCLAGATCKLAGRTAIMPVADLLNPNIILYYRILPTDEDGDPCDDDMKWRQIAKETLGLTEGQAEVIFSAVEPDGVDPQTWHDAQKYSDFVLAYLSGDIDYGRWDLPTAGDQDAAQAHV